MVEINEYHSSKQQRLMGDEWSLRAEATRLGKKQRNDMEEITGGKEDEIYTFEPNALDS